MKRCSVCKANKLVREFYWRQNRKSYLNRCKVCERIRQREYRKNNPRYTQGTYRRKYMLKTYYDMTIADYERLLEKQQSRCAICRTDDPGHRHNTAHFIIDHCHVTGKVRGLLCQNCNHGLGKFKDSAYLLKRAKEYLDESH